LQLFGLLLSPTQKSIDTAHCLWLWKGVEPRRCGTESGGLIVVVLAFEQTRRCSHQLTNSASEDVDKMPEEPTSPKDCVCRFVGQGQSNGDQMIVYVLEHLDGDPARAVPAAVDYDAGAEAGPSSVLDAGGATSRLDTPYSHTNS